MSKEDWHLRVPILAMRVQLVHAAAQQYWTLPLSGSTAVALQHLAAHGSEVVLFLARHALEDLSRQVEGQGNSATAAGPPLCTAPRSLPCLQLPMQSESALLG